MYPLSDQQVALQDLARTFAAKEVRPIAKGLDAEPDLARRYPWEVLDRASSLGLRTLALPAADGGAGLDVLTHCLVFEELAYGDLGFALTLEQTWRLSTLLAEHAEARQTLLPAFRQAPRMLLALADGEKVTARRAGSGWQLDGESRGVVAGGIAGLLLVKANGTTAASLFAVPAAQGGLRTTPVDTLGRRLGPTADLSLAGCAVGEGSLLGEEGQGAAIVERRRRYGRWRPVAPPMT